jgi:uncharacterized protein YjbI with pentapeptide repeats
MALWTGKSYVTNHGRTTVIQGALTPEQREWSEKNRDKDIDAITYLPLTPAQKLYLALCKNGIQLQKALESCGLTNDQKVEAQQALEIRDADGVVTEITRPTFVGADLWGADLSNADLWRADLQNAQMLWAKLWDAQMQGADLWQANLREADLRWAHLRDAQMQGANLKGTKLWGADLRDAQMQGVNLKGTKLWGADISGANFEDAENLNSAFLGLAFYYQDYPPKNLEDALNGVEENKRPMALTRQEYDKVCSLRDSNNRSAFTDELERLGDVCDRRQQVAAAKAKFAWCEPLVSTKVAIMFSSGFDAPTRDELYGNGVGGKFLQGISDRLEALNHLVGRGSRQS